ncbi:pseudouridine synthase [Chiua virens]|nr:pseudouridine synthase [Chiua virens]
MSPNYDTWSKQDLIARLTELEEHFKAGQSHKTSASHHPVRKIAVKFCYSGWEYNGLAYQIDPTPLPTVEEVLFQAFANARLVDAEAGLEGCGWEKCGRTDVGVSAAGQVISLWTSRDVRAPIRVGGLSQTWTPTSPHSISTTNLPPTRPYYHPAPQSSTTSPSSTASSPRPSAFSPGPPSLPSFSARFNCTHRHYKYFFTAHDLDIPRMQQAASLLLGEHDFRNLSKLDPAKQITEFKRRIIRADIARVAGQGRDADAVYVLDLVGSAFLYHQVRHIMAVLFLVGTGLEAPSIVPTLMNIAGSERSPFPDDPPLPIVDRKPEYQMADALPLMLWDCTFSESDVRWQTGDDVSANEDNGDARTKGDLYHQLHSVHQRSLVHTTLEAHFLAAAARFHPPPPQYFPFSATGLTTSTIPLMVNKEAPVLGVPLGGGTYRRGVKYVPILQRKRLDHVEVANARWRTGKGSRRIERADAAHNGTPDNESQRKNKINSR